MKLDKNKVLVAMSGGVDSSVTAALLLEKGYNVVAVTISTHKVDDDCKPSDMTHGCCTYQNMVDAYEVCRVLGIEHKIVDLTKEFEKTIISNFIDEYMSGRTPNPCVQCNNLVKWGMFMDKANELGAHWIATGHYAKIRRDDTSRNYVISRGFDKKKDQSYVLWGLTQEQLERTLLPVGEYEKPETRKLARKFNLPVFDKEESQEICFIPKNDYRHFMRKRIKDFDKKVGRGEVFYQNRVVGEHSGFVDYTVGQRKGIGVTHENPLYVKSINAQLNVIEVAEVNDISSKGLIAKDLNFIKFKLNSFPRLLSAQIRYNSNAVPAYCKIHENGELKVEFVNKQKAVTPGQSVVIYDNGDVVGGGIIKESF